MTGCCGNRRKKEAGSETKDLSESIKEIRSKGELGAVKALNSEFADVHIDLSGQLPLRAKDERTSQLYGKMDYANKMYKKRNYDGALREVERIQNEINDDPYLKMQAWALAAKIYDKTGKTSRRKRSYTKMMEAMEEVRKDSRYKRAYEEGKLCVELIEIAKQKGDDKYAAE